MQEKPTLRQRIVAWWQTFKLNRQRRRGEFQRGRT